MPRTITLEDDEIAIIWSAADVLEMRPDLSQEQAEEVINSVEHRHDACIGINWDVISITADMMFDEPEEDE